MMKTSGMIIGFLLITSNASAVTALGLDNDGVPSYQQTENDPCVIGQPSCKQPDGFTFTNISGLDNDGTITLAEGTSPTYTVGQITTLLGTTAFSIGIDTNQATQTGITLTDFQVSVGGNLLYDFTADTEINLINGNGFSDAVLTGVDFTGLASNLEVVFKAAYTGATDGPETFFLISATATPCTSNCFPTVPEPSALILLGVGLLALPAVMRFRPSK